VAPPGAGRPSRRADRQFSKLSIVRDAARYDIEATTVARQRGSRRRDQLAARRLIAAAAGCVAGRAAGAGTAADARLGRRVGLISETYADTTASATSRARRSLRLMVLVARLDMVLLGKLEASSSTKRRVPPGTIAEGPSGLSSTMSSPVEQATESLDHKRPMRADARRNHEKVVAAAREAFAEHGTSASLEEIARRAEVGIGTLYRNFPNRQALLEAVYVDEVDNLCRSAAELASLPPWDAFVAWVHRLVGYLATKQALAHELLEYVDHDAALFMTCRQSLFGAGQPLLERAQQAHAVRADTNLWEIIQMVGGIAKIPGAEAEQIDHIVEIALDGLRHRDAPA
jgi:AcrR family transcriptional regulator